jgi:hypothetical protein
MDQHSKGLFISARFAVYTCEHTAGERPCPIRTLHIGTTGTSHRVFALLHCVIVGQLCSQRGVLLLDCW